MSNARAYFRIGRALYDIYLHLESTGQEYTLRAADDGLITTPEGVAEAIERIAAISALMKDQDSVYVRADPKISFKFTEVGGAERGSGEQAGPQAPEGETGDAGPGA